jgi:uncharacterized protein YecE (DUF72 family)
VSLRLHVGTSGYSYKEWKGPFYPADLPAAKMLGYYASRFRTVEINSTYYQMPKRPTLESWVAQVPAGFTFTFKAPQQITHRKRLKDAGDATTYFLEALTAVGERLGPALFGLPPNLKKDLPRLEAFLAALPSWPRVAFEFRHPSWLDDTVYEALRTRGAVLCVADTDELETPLVATAGWGYLRLRRPDYTAADLERWAGRIRDAGWSEAWVFLKHEDEGRAPALAERLLSLAGSREFARGSSGPS